jgi:hypothetical protein
MKSLPSRDLKIFHVDLAKFSDSKKFHPPQKMFFSSNDTASGHVSIWLGAVAKSSGRVNL